jgi:hypothetical protein
MCSNLSKDACVFAEWRPRTCISLQNVPCRTHARLRGSERGNTSSAGRWNVYSNLTDFTRVRAPGREHFSVGPGFSGPYGKDKASEGLTLRASGWVSVQLNGFGEPGAGCARGALIGDRSVAVFTHLATPDKWDEQAGSRAPERPTGVQRVRFLPHPVRKGVPWIG